MRQFTLISLVLLLIFGITSAQDDIDLEGFLVFSGVSSISPRAIEPFQIFVQNLETGVVTQLTDSELTHRTPRFSPDCEQITYRVAENQRGLNPDVPAEIHVMSIDGTNDIRIDNGKDAPRYLGEWSPNGNFITYVEFDTVTIFNTMTEQYQSAQTAIRLGGAWSPDSENYIFGTRDDTLIIYNLLDEAESVIDIAPYDAWRLQWSPTGDNVAFLSFDFSVEELRHSLVTLDLETQTPKVVARGDGIDHFVWSPDGESLIYWLYLQGEGEIRDIFLTNFTEEMPNRLTNGDLVFFNIDWEREGQVFISGVDFNQYGSPSPPFHVYSLAISDDSIPIQITSDDYDVGDFDWCIPPEDE